MAEPTVHMTEKEIREFIASVKRSLQAFGEGDQETYLFYDEQNTRLSTANTDNNLNCVNTVYDESVGDYLGIELLKIGHSLITARHNPKKFKALHKIHTRIRDLKGKLDALLHSEEQVSDNYDTLEQERQQIVSVNDSNLAFKIYSNATWEGFSKQLDELLEDIQAAQGDA